MKTHKKTKLLLIFIFLLSIHVFSQNENDYSKLKKEYTEIIEKTMKKKNILGASIIVIDENRIVWEDYFGYQDAEKEIPLSEKSLFKIGSVSKLFTGTAIMQLVQKDKLDLDKPVTNYIPSFKIKQRFKNAKPITTRMILTHHAGLPCDILKGFESDNLEDYRNELNLLNLEYTIFPPNYIRAYSNPGFNFLGILTGKITDTTYMTYVRKNIFNPLKMNNSLFYGYNNDKGYLCKNYNSKGKPKYEGYIREIPAGGIVSNVKDLSKFVIEWLPQNNKENILDKKHKKIMLEEQVLLPLDLNKKNALVWFIEDNTKAGKIYNHGGATFYHISMLALAPQSGLGIIILTNSSSGFNLTYLYKEILEKAAQIKHSELKQAPIEQKKYPTDKVKLKDKHLKKFTGFYAFPVELFKVELRRNKLRLNIQNNKIVLFPVDKNIFIPKIKILFFGFKIKKVRFIFKEINNEKVLIKEEVESGDKIIFGQKIKKQKIPESWKKRIGKYKIVNNKINELNILKNIEIYEKNGFLIISYKIISEKNHKMTPCLKIVSDKLAYVAGLGRQAGQSIQVIKNDKGQEHLYFYGFKLQKIN